MKGLAAFWATGLLLAQSEIKPVVRQGRIGEKVAVVRLAPRYSTAIEMPEAIRSVVVGDPVKFLAEHSEKEPALVMVKPVVMEPAESNLLITTVSGRNVSVLLRSEGGQARSVDFLLRCRLTGSFLVEESAVLAAAVPGTETLRSQLLRDANTQFQRAALESDASPHDPLDELLKRQRQAALPDLYGTRAPAPNQKGDRIRASVSEVLNEGRTVIVLFSVTNPQSRAIEILPPQVQLAGQTRKGFLIKRSRWGTSEQLPVKEFRLRRRRLAPGERADGVVVFTRPNFKQSNESLFLQVAESGAIDKPALAPIGFGVSALRKESNHGE